MSPRGLARVVVAMPPAGECDRCGDVDRVLSPVNSIEVRDKGSSTWRPYVVCGECWTYWGGGPRKCADRPDVRQGSLFDEPA